MPTAQKSKTVTFYSWCHNQELVFRAEVPLFTAQGARYRTLPGRRLVFENSVLTIPVDEEDFRFWTGDTDEKHTDPINIVAWLRGEIKGDDKVSRELFNTPQGFWEQGASPDEPKPTTAEQMQAITRAAAERDIGEVRSILEVEATTNNRDVVLAAAQTAIETLTEAPEAGAEEKDESTSAPSPTG